MGKKWDRNKVGLMTSILKFLLQVMLAKKKKEMLSQVHRNVLVCTEYLGQFSLY